METTETALTGKINAIFQSRKNIWLAGLVVLIIVVLVAGYFIFKKISAPQSLPFEPSQEEIIKSLTAPVGSSPAPSKEVLNSLTAPAPKTKGATKPAAISEDIMDSITAPAR